MAYQYGATGPVLRGSGVEDLRKKRPYGMYEKFDFDVPVGEGVKGQVGDRWDRYHVRVQEMFESLKLFAKFLTVLKKDLSWGKFQKSLKFLKVKFT